MKWSSSSSINEMERAPVMTPTENHVEMKCEYIRSYFAAWVLMAVLGAHLTELLSATPRSVYGVFSRLGLSDYNRENLQLSDYYPIVRL
jgi:hypothetical protein